MILGAAAPEDKKLRARLAAEYDDLGGEAFRQKLAAADPERAEKLAGLIRSNLPEGVNEFVYIYVGNAAIEWTFTTKS